MIVSYTIGREKEIEGLLRNVQRGAHTLLVGRGGIGKTHLLLELQRRLRESEYEIIYVPTPHPAKEVAASLYSHFAAVGRVREPKKIGPRTGLNEIAAQIGTLLALPAFAEKKMLVLLDEADQTSPYLIPVFEMIADKATIIGAGRTVKKARKFDRFFWKFEEIEVAPLPASETRRLVERAIENVPGMSILEGEDKERRRSIIGRLFGRWMSTREFLINQVVNLSNGVPAAVVEIVERELTGAERIDADYVRDLFAHRAGDCFVDATPAVLVVFVFLVVMRYVNRGMYQFDMYALFGALSGFMLIVRYFMYRGARETVQ